MRVDEADPPTERVRLDELRVAPGPPEVLDPRITVPANPLTLLIVIVEVPEEPAGMVIEFGPAEMSKFGAAVTVTSTVAV